MSISMKPHRELEGEGEEVEVPQAVSGGAYLSPLLPAGQEGNEREMGEMEKNPKPKPIRALGSQGNCFCGWSPSSVRACSWGSRLAPL